MQGNVTGGVRTSESEHEAQGVLTAGGRGAVRQHRAYALLRVGRAEAARALLERWLSDDAPADDAQYERIAELYAVHTLGALRDFDAATAFLDHNTSLRPETLRVRRRRTHTRG